MGVLSGMSLQSCGPLGLGMLGSCWGHRRYLCVFFFCDMRCLAVGQLSRLSD